ncbi:MAG: alpha/beta hydrolase fold domain-containing protein [Gammaproteobacteria bacterium]|nr:alpha/beta hydrolase fold domain-containing protein [Gammaproteobacteria bacterium]
MNDRNAYLPGRLGDPSATLEFDPRADPRIIEVLKAVGGFAPGIAPVGVGASYEECLAYCRAFEEAAAAGNEMLLAALPKLDTVERSTQTITGVDGNPITLYIHRPKAVTGKVPCVVHTHGGGMVLMTAADPMFVRWRDSLADAGVLTIGVEFRNGGGKLGNHPFPAGLNDCASATQWAYAQRDALGVSCIVISGESGGGNLAIATTLKARREGWLDQISGVFAMCPYISGAYANPPPALVSLYENDGYMLDCEQMAALVKVYDPKGQYADNPLAWPLAAQASDLAGLPPHIISVNELDPLRDEGLAYYRKLVRAGVPAVARTVHGTPHAGDVGYPDVTPELYQDTLRSLTSFARSLA